MRRRRRTDIRRLLPLLVLLVLLAVLSRFDWGEYYPTGESSVPPQDPVSQSDGDSSYVSANPAVDTGDEIQVRMQVYFLDVGQGDSELVQVPTDDGMFNMLIDTGESEYGGGLLAYLEDLGVKKIDALVMTHPHTDHMGGMGRLIRNMEVSRLYMPVVPEDRTPTTYAYERVLDASEEKNVPITRLVTGTQIDVPDTISVQVLSPEEDADWEGMNNYSAVLRITAGETAFLFAGDAEQESEAVILENGGDLSAQVLKLGHHGSSTSTSLNFFDAVAPSYAIISCGKDNDYGHPHREIRALLSENNIAVYRTDEDGTILAITDGKEIVFQKGLASVQGAEQ